jgi:CheY-like chemotaxis protein/anti-sigma regulatory factor (Ser/Thr protein kinase)
MASIGMLAAGVAHEINNPLTFVIANLDFVQEQLTAFSAGGSGHADRYEDSRAALADAQVGAERVKRIVLDLKAFSRPCETAKGPVEVHQMLDATLTMAMSEIRHRARFVKDYFPEPLFVEGNDSRLSQVMLNLLVNAAQAIAEGATASNEVRLSTRRGRDGWVQLEVRDSGQGMSPETRSHLFAPFFTTKPQGVGTGLGLAICHQIVTDLGGRIEVESALGRGSSFTVSLPPAGGAPVPPALPAPAPSPPTRRGRVLIVDDEPMVREVIQRMVGAKHVALVAGSGAEALEIIAREPPFDVIFCDLMMPEMSGAEVHAAITSGDPALAARMVFITGGVFTQNAKAFLARTPNLTLEKPFASKLLLQVVEQALQGRGSAGVAPSK